MPYIDPARRFPLVSGLIEPKDWTAGDLNFLITVAGNAFIEGHGMSYGSLNAVIGAMECAKQEFYRRLAVPYENTKISLNGDVYGTVNEPEKKSILEVPTKQ